MSKPEIFIGAAVVLVIVILFVTRKQSASSVTLRAREKYAPASPMGKINSPLGAVRLDTPKRGGFLAPPMLSVAVPDAGISSPLYAGYAGVAMNMEKFPADNEMNAYFTMPDAYSGASLRQIPIPPTGSMTTFNHNDEIKYGVIRPKADDSLYSFFGPMMPVQGNLDKYNGVL